VLWVYDVRFGFGFVSVLPWCSLVEPQPDFFEIQEIQKILVSSFSSLLISSFSSLPISQKTENSDRQSDPLHS
jgi:hypothetical protein